MADWVADYRETIGSRRIVSTVVPGDVTTGLSSTIPELAESLDVILRDFDETIMPGIVHWGHPSFVGYFGSTSNGPALLGEIAAAALNVSAMTWRTSPAATELESVVLRWIREMLGLPHELVGVVYDTASVAVVHALAAARERGIDARVIESETLSLDIDVADDLALLGAHYLSLPDHVDIVLRDLLVRLRSGEVVSVESKNVHSH